MQPVLTPPRVLAAEEWTALTAAHEARVDRWLEPHRDRRRRGQAHPVLDFLFTYYSETPGRLRRWHPGPQVALAPSADGPAPHAGRRWYAADDRGVVRLDTATFAADRADTVPRNRLQPTRDTQTELEQPGCLHAGMDLYMESACT